MLHRSEHNRTRFHMNSADAGVITATAVALTHEWWQPMLSAIPGIAQGLVLSGTIVYVLFRAANEVRKFFWPNRGDDQ